jgi:hypothetical protein
MAVDPVMRANSRHNVGESFADLATARMDNSQHARGNRICERDGGKRRYCQTLSVIRPTNANSRVQLR